MWRFHVGTLAFAAGILPLFQPPRIFLEFLFRKSIGNYFSHPTVKWTVIQYLQTVKILTWSLGCGVYCWYVFQQDLLTRSPNASKIAHTASWIPFYRSWAQTPMLWSVFLVTLPPTETLQMKLKFKFSLSNCSLNITKPNPNPNPNHNDTSSLTEFQQFVYNLSICR